MIGNKGTARKKPPILTVKKFTRSPRFPEADQMLRDGHPVSHVVRMLKEHHQFPEYSDLALMKTLRGYYDSIPARELETYNVPMQVIRHAQALGSEISQLREIAGLTKILDQALDKTVASFNREFESVGGLALKIKITRELAALITNSVKIREIGLKLQIQLGLLSKNLGSQVAREIEKYSPERISLLQKHFENPMAQKVLADPEFLTALMERLSERLPPVAQKAPVSVAGQPLVLAGAEAELAQAA